MLKMLNSQRKCLQNFKVALQMKTKYNLPKPRNPVARDLRSPKYKMRVVDSKVSYIRQPKHRKVNNEFE